MVALLQHTLGQSRHSGLQHGSANDLLLTMDGIETCHAYWFQEELIDRKSLKLEQLTGSEYAEIQAEKRATSRKSGDVRKTTKDAAEMCNDARESGDEEEGEVLITKNVNVEKFEEDTCGTVPLVALLKACAEKKDLVRGSRIHATARNRGFLEKNVFVGSAIVSMYGKCGALAKAQEAFDELGAQNVVSWNALIAGYVQHRQVQKAWEWFMRMQDEGIPPDGVTFSCILKACGSIGASERGQVVHAQVVREGLLEKSTIIGNALMDMYIKCGMILRAGEVFEELPSRDVVSWTALITGYTLHGYGDEAVNCFERMQLEGGSPNAATFLGILKTCGTIRAACKGQEIHAEIVGDGLLEGDIVVGTALVDMYAKCGMLMEAQDVFDELPVQDTVLWSTLIDGYAQNMQGQEAVNCFEQMQLKGFSPDEVTFACVLKACCSLGAGDKGQELQSIGASEKAPEIHAKVLREGLVESDIVIGNAWVDMYAKIGMLDKARGVPADTVTLSTLEKLCGKGQEIHNRIIKEGKWQKSIVVSNSLIDMYAKCGLLQKAQDIFDRLAAPDTVSWNALMSGYVQHGHAEKTLDCFRQMQARHTTPNSVTYLCILKACGSLGDAERGQAIHAQICKCESLEQDVVIATALVDMYAKCGVHGRAQEVFDKIPDRDTVSWNALVTGYIQAGYGEKALEYYELMQISGNSPDAITFVCLMKACGDMGALCKGREMHAEMVKRGWLEKNTAVGTAVIEMYANCGVPSEGKNVFDKVFATDVVMWNSLIAGYALLGEDEPISKLFHEMNGRPDLVTFTIVLNTCSHGGLLGRGKMWFELMTLGYGLKKPALQHYTCIVDLFARAGQVEKAVAVVGMMSVGADMTLWHALIGACLNMGNMELGIWASKHAAQMDKADCAAYVSIGNMCASAESLTAFDDLEMGT